MKCLSHTIHQDIELSGPKSYLVTVQAQLAGSDRAISEKGPKKSNSSISSLYAVVSVGTNGVTCGNGSTFSSLPLIQGLLLTSLVLYLNGK